MNATAPAPVSHPPVSHLIDGKRIESTAEKLFDKYSPYDGSRLFSFPVGASADVDRAAQSARQAFDDGRWSGLRPSVRKQTLYRYADLVERQASTLDRLDAQEMGKPVSVAFCNAARGADYIRFFAEALDKVTGDVMISDTPSYMTQRRVPIGVVGAIAAWNFPTFVALMKFVPALAAGNTVVLKPSEFSPGSALLLAELALEAGLPAGVLNVVVGTGEVIGRALGLHPDVDMISFTGSTQVGKLFMQYSGQSNLKKVLVECGGKSPQIVFDDGLNLDQVADAISGSILTNQGQVCSAGTRVVVQNSIESELLAKVAQRFKAVKMGNPVDPNVTFGPIASQQQLSGVEAHIAKAIEGGAELVVGGQRVLKETGGNFIEPTLFRKVDPQASIARQEIFGPVLSTLTFGNEDEAVAIANGTDFGLSATLWTTRIGTGLRVAKRIRSSVMIKTGAVDSEGAGFASSGEPAAQSGIGVENGLPGLESYMRRQSISIIHG